MRKSIILTALMLIAAPVSAQTTLGLKGGIGLATVSIEEAAVEEESLTRIVAGLELGVPVSDMFSVTLGGSYAQKGGGATVDDVGVTLEIDYIQLSALAKLTTSPMGGGGVSVGAMAGPWIAYRLSCDVGVAAEGLSLSAPCEDRSLSDFDIKAFDYGLAFGGGIEVPLFGNLRLGLDALYSLGLGDVDEGDSKTRLLTVQAGLVFPIG